MKHSSILLHFPSLSSLTIVSSSNKTMVKDPVALDSPIASSLRPSNNISAISRTSTVSSASITTASTASTIGTISSHPTIDIVIDTRTPTKDTSNNKGKRRSFINQVKSFFQRNSSTHSNEIQYALDNNSNELIFKKDNNGRRKVIEKRRSVPPAFMSKEPSTCFHPQMYDDKVYLQQSSNSTKPYQRYKRCLSDYGELIRNKHSSKNCSIGTGASATVVLTQRKDKYTNTTAFYAVKVFHPITKHGNTTTAVKQIHRRNNNKMTIRSEAHFMKKLISEFCISSSLHHPNIVKTLDLVVDGKNRFCTVMEYCSGGDLYNFIKEGRLTCIEEVNGYFKQLLNGLAYLHRIGVAHRDIKPENLLLAGGGILKITDFGEADVFREAHHLDQNSTTAFSLDTATNDSIASMERLSDGLCGSTPYIAPEIFVWARQGYKASQADVWSAGIVYFCMRFNGVPFYSATQTDSNYRLYQKCFDSYQQQQQQQQRKSTLGVNSDKDSGNVRDDDEDLIFRQRGYFRKKDGSSLTLSTVLSSSIASFSDNESFISPSSSVIVDYPAFRELDLDAKDMLYSMLNPDPEQRYTIQDVLNLSWLAEVKPPTEDEKKPSILSAPVIDHRNKDTSHAHARVPPHLKHSSQCIDKNNTTRFSAKLTFRRSVA